MSENHKLHHNLTLMGFQASGKTTIGQMVAKRMQKSFFDTDRLIEQHHLGLNCSEIFKYFGEVYFRDLESQVIQQLQYIQRSVIAIGGGALNHEINRLSLKKHSLFIYLKTDPSVLKERIWKRSSLPNYLDSRHPHTSFTHVYSERVLLYEAMADLTLDMQHFTFEEVVDQISSISI